MRLQCGKDGSNGEVQLQGESARYEPGSPPAEPRRLNKVQHPLSQPIVTSGCKRCDRMTGSMVGWWSHQVLLISFNTMHSGPVALLVKPARRASPVLTSKVSVVHLSDDPVAWNSDTLPFVRLPGFSEVCLQRHVYVHEGVYGGSGTWLYCGVCFKLHVLLM